MAGTQAAWQDGRKKTGRRRGLFVRQMKLLSPIERAPSEIKTVGSTGCDPKRGGEASKMPIRKGTFSVKLVPTNKISNRLATPSCRCEPILLAAARCNPANVERAYVPIRARVPCLFDWRLQAEQVAEYRSEIGNHTNDIELDSRACRSEPHLKCERGRPGIA